MAIVDMKATTVAVPVEAPLRHAAGAHWEPEDIASPERG